MKNVYSISIMSVNYIKDYSFKKMNETFKFLIVLIDNLLVYKKNVN